ncbi:MAG: recombinase RecF [Sulfurovum sp.]|nr:MAG: recombinase RecF [Sulfurovum sp.]
MIKIDKIQLHNFRFFIDEEEHNSFELDGQNMLVYGENGSGKSSLYKAFELLAKPIVSDEEFEKSVNIFKQDDSYLEFEFDNNETLRIDSDHLSLEDDYPFVEKLSITKPILDYKHLLNVSYSQNSQREEKNLFAFFKKILEEYPIGENEKKLKDLEDEEHFEHFERIIQEELFDDINLFLEKFQQNFKITSISLSVFGKAYLQIEYFNKDISDYRFHLFLNEARLSALAISVYFAIIKKQFTLLGENSLKVLVLDDLLISLDMNNRLNLIDILKSEFSDFQIFFFTHDKGFFEILKEKMSWKSYELYVDNEGEFEKPYIKKSLNYFESAKKHFDEYDYPACANYLRKEVERLKKIKEKQEMSINQDEKIFKKIKKMLLSPDFMSDSDRVKSKLIGFKKGLEEQSDSNVEIDLKDIKSITDRILNPQSHDDTSKPLYKKELEEAIEIIGRVRENI